MTTLEDARMPSLRDKHLAQAAEAAKPITAEKPKKPRKKGRKSY